MIAEGVCQTSMKLKLFVVANNEEKDAVDLPNTETNRQ